MHNKYLLNECICSEVDGIFVQLSHLTNVHRGSMIAKKKKKKIAVVASFFECLHDLLGSVNQVPDTDIPAI